VRHGPWVVGHRGAAGLEPENTLRAFRRALALGVDAVECDVHLTRDGVPVVLHDATLERTTDGAGAVRDLTWAELARLDAGQGERIPRLEEVVALVRGRAHLVVELKARGAHGPVLDCLRGAAALSEATLIAFDLEELAAAARAAPEAARGALFHRLPPDGPTRARALGCAWAFLEFRAAEAEGVAALRSAGLRVGLWTPNEEPELRAALALAPDAVTTDRPDRLLPLLGRTPRAEGGT
jgi:glycerophosphoryl diester phosphodiesterase